MEFDLGDLTLDLGAPAKPAALPPAAALAAADIGVEAAADDPLATKLALAQEFNAIGDTDGARTLVEEVVAESSGALKAAPSECWPTWADAAGQPARTARHCPCPPLQGGHGGQLQRPALQRLAKPAVWQYDPGSS
jgi:FimV-like protein